MWIIPWAVGLFYCIAIVAGLIWWSLRELALTQRLLLDYFVAHPNVWFRFDTLQRTLKLKTLFQSVALRMLYQHGILERLADPYQVAELADQRGIEDVISIESLIPAHICMYRMHRRKNREESIVPSKPAARPA